MKKVDWFEEPQLVKLYGDEQVAEVAVLRFAPDERFTVETVDGLAPPLARRDKWIINVSTQFGCPVGCPFCDAAFDYAGNLDVRQLLAQVEWAAARHPEFVSTCRKLKVHFARMGEPGLNDAVPEAMRALPELLPTPGLWTCVATIAPRGRETWFQRLFTVKREMFHGHFQLQFSVQSTSEQHRDRLIPMPHLSLQQLARLGRDFFEPGDRKVVLNFALARDVDFNPEVIGRIFAPDRFAVKLTPVNPTAAGQQAGMQTLLRSERAAALDQACKRLQQMGFDVVISIGDEREDSIGSNCGQAVRVTREANQAESPDRHYRPAATA